MKTESCERERTDSEASIGAGCTKVAFTTFGCRLNQYDTESLRTLLQASARFETVDRSAEPDVFVVNTCSVTAQADAAARKAIRRIHSRHPGARIVVAGCYAQRAPHELAAIEGVSLVIGAADRERIAEEIERAAPPGAARLAVSPIEDARTFLEVPIAEMTERSRAFVKIQEGCDEACAFCIIPQTRGRSRSRALPNVVVQVERLLDAGYSEVVLTGVHLGDYGMDLDGRRLLSDLIRRLLRLPGLSRLRLSSIEPASISEELIDLMASERKFARHFHIPFQSGNDEILRRMGRRYSAAGFRSLVERIANRIPGCGIGSDVICGFPGESDSHFQDTFDLLVELPVTYIHPFTYSNRPGSASAGFDGQVPGEVKKRRTRALKRLSAVKTEAAQSVHLGEVVEVLAEVGQGTYRQFAPRANAVETRGWTDNYLRVRCISSAPIADGKPVSVQLERLEDAELIGTVVSGGSA